MPYTNLPESEWNKMDRCVVDVQKQGHDKKAAIAICYASITGTKREKAAGMTVLPTGTSGEYTGIIASLWVDREIANQVALPPDQYPDLTPLQPDDLHITLCFLGEGTDPAMAAAKNQIMIALATLALALPPITVNIGGLGQFFAPDGESESALYASVDSPFLTPWYEVLKSGLASMGIDPAKSEHGFNPHLTLAYTNSPVDLATIQVAPIPIRFTHLTLAWAGELIHFPLMGDIATTKAEESSGGGSTRSGSHSSGGSSRSRSSGTTRSGNWGAKAGQIIRGNLARGNDGKFTSAGRTTSSTAKKPKRYEDGSLVGGKPKHPLRRAAGRGRAAAKPKAAPKGRKTGVGSRGGKTLSQQLAERALRDRERQAQKIKREQERQAAQAKRETERADAKKKRDEERAARDAKRNEGKGGKGSGGGKSSGDKAADKAKKKKVYQAIDNYGEGNKLSSEEQKLLIDEGLAVLGPDGRLLLTAAGKRTQAEEAADDKKKEWVLLKAFQQSVGGGVKREELRDSDFALSDERKFPVVIPKDVADAVSSWGRYKGKTSFETFKKNLTALAKRKGPEFVAKLPASWSVKTKSASFEIFKQADGRHRWILFSSNAYRDRDGEIVSTKALEDDVERANATGEYGPLRWWHVPGCELGVCDFNMVLGRVLVESGTFLSPAVGEAVALKSDELQASLGFIRPPNAPDKERVFHEIVRFERSLLPRGRAANNLTAVMVRQKENPMLSITDKLAALKGLFGEKAASDILAAAQQIEAKAAEEGIEYKAAKDMPTDDEASPVVEEKVVEEETVTEDMTADEEPVSEDTGDGETYLADLTVNDFIEVIGTALGEGLRPILEAFDIESKMAGHTKSMMDGLNELKTMYGTRTKEATDAAAASDARIDELETALAALKIEYEQRTKALSAELATTKALANELAGEAPPTITRGYRASAATETVVGDNHRLKGAGNRTQTPDALDWFTSSGQ